MLVRARATIDLEAIASNWTALNHLSGAAETSAVVKANAYGHGATDVSRRLLKAGCRTFFVATISEGIELRTNVGPEPHIFVFNGAAASEYNAAKNANIVPVINSLKQLQDWQSSEFASTKNMILHVDTGMNRLGISPNELADVTNLVDGAAVSTVMSHLACAEEPDNEMNEYQRQLFSEIAGTWPEAKRSLSNSAGLALRSGAYAFDMVRPGIAIYGGGIELPTNKTLMPTITLEAPILSVFYAEVGSSTGYGATATFNERRRLATVGAGYADGISRSLSNKGSAAIEGERCRIVGRVSMDLTTIDITDIGAQVQPGMAVEFIGRYAGLEQQAAAAGTLGYELLTGISPRVERVWHG